jgi:hypothetical protein
MWCYPLCQWLSYNAPWWCQIVLFGRLSLFWWLCSDCHFIHHTRRTLRFWVVGHSLWCHYEKIKKGGKEDHDGLDNGCTLVDPGVSAVILPWRQRKGGQIHSKPLLERVTSCEASDLVVEEGHSMRFHFDWHPNPRWPDTIRPWQERTVPVDHAHDGTHTIQAILTRVIQKTLRKEIGRPIKNGIIMIKVGTSGSSRGISPIPTDSSPRMAWVVGKNVLYAYRYVIKISF